AAKHCVKYIKVTAPTGNQEIGSTVDVKWDTTVLPCGLKRSDRVSVRIRCVVESQCGREQFPPASAVPSVPFTDGHKEINIPNDPTLVNTTFQAIIFDENSDVSGFSVKF
ncbi:13576_t:CDS:2, partial [Acaulospora colombiana]